MKNRSLKYILFIGMFVATTGCVVEMHPADSSPAPSAMQSTAGGAPATAAQPVQVVSGPSGINPPVRSAQPTGTTDTTSTTTTPANGETTGAASTSTSAGGTSAALR